MSLPAARPNALLLFTSTCPHCPVVLAGLTDLANAGLIGKLETTNIELLPEVASRFGVRTVPWVRLGPFELEGLHSPAELRHWAERATQPHALAGYFRDLLKDGRLAKVTDYLRRENQSLAELLHLLDDRELEITVRIGINAVFEELEGDPLLGPAFEKLAPVTTDENAQRRADAAHLLSLTHDPRAIPLLEGLLGDANADAREVAVEGLERLRAGRRH